MSASAEFFTTIAAQHRRCFWLDGGGARGWSGRRSLIGWLDDDAPSLTYDATTRTVTEHRNGTARIVGDDIFGALDERLVPGDQWVGMWGYASSPDFPARGDDRMPDAIWMRATHTRFFDETPTPSPAHPPAAVRGDTPRDYAEAFAQVQAHLHAGNSYEVNLTYRDDVVSQLTPPQAYLSLRAHNPAPYAGFLQHDVAGHRGWLLSSSPERYALIDVDRVISTRPIKGTTARGDNPEADAAAAHHLASSPRYRAENLMIVDLLRNDVAKVSEPGSVTVPSLMAVESYPAVHQLVSTIEGRVRDDVSTVQALKSLFPAGSMTGAPKLRTMQIIDAVESTARGAYSGAFGWISGDGRADLGVIIRSFTTTGDGVYTYGTGGGITVQSQCDEEYAETRWKAARLTAALGLSPATSP